jgi:hypothetical protein
MVLTAAQTTAFFEQATQMAIPNATVIALQSEGINNIGDLIDFDKATLTQVADNLRRPGGGGAPLVFGAKSQQRLLAATNLVRYYDTVGRPSTAGNLQWERIMRNFKEQYKALKDKKEADPPDVPKITKALPIIKWTESMLDYLHRIIGGRMIPLAYVVRELVILPAAAPASEQHQPYSTEHGSIEAELIARAPHDHALYRDDNAEFYYKLEEATRGTAYADSIKPFQRAKNGRGDWLALTSQYAGEDKWEMEIKKMDNLLHTRRWKGQSNFLLERHTQQHRNAYVSMTACAQHVDYQLPNEHTRVGYLIDSIKNNDAGLQATLGAIRNDKGATGMRSNFESAVAHLLPMDPVAKQQSAGVKCGSADISNTTADIAGFGAKPGLGKTGVHLRYYKDAEYRKLNKDQQDELREWRKSADYSGKKPNKGVGRPQKQARHEKGALASAVEKEVSKRLTISVTGAPPPSTISLTDDEARAYIMSLLRVAPLPPTVVGATTASTALVKRVTLQSILAKAKSPRG